MLSPSQASSLTSRASRNSNSNSAPGVSWGRTDKGLQVRHLKAVVQQMRVQFEEQSQRADHAVSHARMAVMNTQDFSARLTTPNTARHPDSGRH